MDLQSVINSLRDRGRKMVALDNPQEQDMVDIGADIGAGFLPGVGQVQAGRDFERARRDGDKLGMGLAGFGMVPFVGGMSKVVGALRKGKKAGSVIGDWRWRPMKEVQEDVQLSEVPSYITDNYGEFMVNQAGKASAGDLTPRDLLKAYTITRSSVNRGARAIDDDLVQSAEARPEGYFAEWLLSPAGQDFLRGAQKGKVDEAAVSDIVRRFNSFGMAPTLGDDMRWAAGNLPDMAGGMNDAVTGSPEAWRAFAQSLHGIGPSKSGFVASMLGRGDMPTFDARQINLHTGKPSTEASKFVRRQGGAGGDAAVDRLAARQREMNLQLPEKFAPHYQHLTHHAVWDKVAGSKTTHDDLIRAMERGSVDPALLGVLGAGAGGLTVAALRNRKEEKKQ